MVEQLADIALVRTNLGEDPTDEATYVLPDSAIATWLAAFRGNTDRATARALITIAASEVLTSKVITSQDLSTNGDRVSAELRALADYYLVQADRDAGDTYFSGYVPPAQGRHAGEAEEARRWFM